MRAIIFLALACSACASPSGPTPTPTPTPVTPPAPSTYTITGTVTATNGGQVLGGLAVDLSGLATSTNASGVFSYSMTAGTISRLNLNGGGIVPRALTLNVGSARTIGVSAIALSGGFDLDFYRQLVRDRYDGLNEPLRRWTRNPSIYLRTVDDAGGAIDSRTLDSTENAIRETTPLWTAGHFTVATVERGTATKVGSAGWITVTWPAAAEPTTCGRANVGLEGGTIDLYYKTGGSCRCSGGPEIRPRTVKHEVGHAMGFWHTDSTADLMSGAGAAGCDGTPSARELAAAAIAYARPVGNVDPDSDPASTVSLAPMRAR